jgi:hypothetical protein
MLIASESQLRKPRGAFNPRAATSLNRDNQTIIGVPFESSQPLRSMLLDQRVATVVPDFRGHRLFKIRAADSHGQRSSASILLNRMYATRGYKSNGVPAAAAPNKITLTACEHDDTMGTITVGFDSPAGLSVDELFGKEVDELRNRGRRVCEFTKLAMDSLVRSKRVLASLFHVAYIYAHRINGYQELLIEVNPRHVRYYERMLGFVAHGAERLCPRVNAPAVLMSLDFKHAHDQIAQFGGQQHLADDERSLYPYFFSVGEEAGIVGRLCNA